MPAPDLLDRLTQGWRAWALIALVSLAAALPGVFAMPPLDRDESRFAQASVQMLETGDYVRIAVQDQPRNKKPVGIYWLQAASTAAFSKASARAIWSYRLPSVLGALIAALATFWTGQRLIGRRAAFIGACLFASSLLIGVEGMTAKTDAMLCGLTTLALAALARLRTLTAHPRAVALIFWAALGAGILIKGPVTPLAAFGALAALYVWERKADWMKPLAWWPGPALALLIVLPWGVAIWSATNGQFFSDAIGHDLGSKVAGGDEGHSGPPLYHFALVWLLLFPATIALPGALRLIWRTARGPRADDEGAALRFLIACIVPVWLVFELLPTKLPHYALPAYPPLALLCAAALTTSFEQDWKKLRLAARAIAIIGALILVGLCAALAYLMPGDAAADQKRAVQTILVTLLLFSPFLYFIVHAKSAALLAAASCAIALLFAFTARERILPRTHAVFVSEEASEALLRAGLHPRFPATSPPLTILGDNEPSLIFLTRTDSHLNIGADAGTRAQVGDVYLVEQRQRADFEAALAARGLAFAPAGAPAEGINYAAAKTISLQPGRVISAAAAKAP